MNFSHLFLLITLALSFVPRWSARAAPDALTCSSQAVQEWQEARTQAFAVLVSPAENPEISQAVLQQASAMDAELARFQALFEATLPVPITIRLYPDEDTFGCLNAQVSWPAPGSTHAHIGTREIALISANLSLQPEVWRSGLVQVLRYELGALFVENLAAQQAPPGLAAATGFYLQDPAQTIQHLQLPRSDWRQPQRNMSELWEDPETGADLRKSLEALSTVAFLVDTRDWPTYVAFIKGIAAAGGYRQALEASYQADLSGLEVDWEKYFPEFFSDRWRANALYNYDLTPHQKLVQAGAYSDADARLRQIIPFLELSQQAEKTQQAHSLLGQAQSGQEAEAMIDQALLAVQSGDYASAVQLAGQAQARLSRLGNYTRLDQLAAFRDQVQKIEAAHQDLQQLQGQVDTHPNPFALGSQLQKMATKFRQLGDRFGQVQVQQVAPLVEARQRQYQFFLSLAGGGVILALLAWRIWLARKEPPVEAQL